VIGDPRELTASLTAGEPAHAFCGRYCYLGTPGGTGRQIGATPTLYSLGINLRSGRVEAR
jgi:hypothetical protein